MTGKDKTRTDKTRSKLVLSRRRLLIGAGAAAAASSLAACAPLDGNESLLSVVKMAEKLTMGAQRLLLSGGAMAREFSEADLSPVFKANGTQMPDSDDYQALADGNFTEWRLAVNGLVEKPLSLSLADLKALPSRTQITRHDCVEGWSAIGKWTGVPLGLVLKAAGLKPNARYVVFHCADEYEKSLDGNGWYYESIDLVDAFHPQTILAYRLNGEDLPIAHGAPLRLRVERQLGYKQAKYLMRLEVVESFAQFYGGNGGFWEDRGYEWYAGV